MYIDKHNPLKDNMIQILAPDGTCDPALIPKELTDDVVKQLYENMVLCRMANDRALKMQRSGRMGTYASVEGEEACQLASQYALEKTDWIVPAFRELAAMWAHGVPMENIYLYWMGNEIGSKIPDNVNVLPVSIPVGSHPLHAVGISWASKLRGEKTVATAYFGDGATSEGDFHEAMNFAGVFKTPTIFICQNNQYAISVPRNRQTAAKTIAQKAIAYGFPGILVDGMDLFAMYAVAKEAVQRARNGDGPTFIEAYCYRYGDHTTADDATIYRDPKEVEKWRPKDPIIRLQKYLATKNIWTQAYEDELRERLQVQVDEITKKAEDTPNPTIDEIFDHTYAELTPQLVEQKQQLKEIHQTRSER